jgi:hypothetical protein
MAGKLVGGWLASRMAPGVAPSDLGAYLIPPGVIGVAFALNLQQVAPGGRTARLRRGHRSRGQRTPGCPRRARAEPHLMRRLLALASRAIVWLVVQFGAGVDTLRPTALALGFALIAAALAGGLLEHVGLPRVTGYLLFGMICGPYVANIITRPMARELQLINGLAVVLIAFIAGLEMNFARMRPRLRAMLQLGGVTMLGCMSGLLPGSGCCGPGWVSETGNRRSRNSR